MYSNRRVLLWTLVIALGISGAGLIDAQVLSTGLVFADEEDYRDIPLASAPMMGTLPERVDLSRWFPPPGDQGEQGSCVGWAVAYGLKSYQEARERKSRPQDRSQIFSPAYIYNQIRVSDCGDGSLILDALNLLRREGVASMADFPYDPRSCARRPDSRVKARARAYTIADWRRVDFKDDVEVKSQLNAGFPVVIGMIVDRSFMSLRGNAIYRGSSGLNQGGHAMVVVGYDDSRSAYKVLNSWGSDWGNGGYGWIAYSAFRDQVREAYTAQDVVIADPDEVPPSPGPGPRPAPAPVPSQDPSASLGSPFVMHNQPVPGPYGPVPGMVIRVPGQILYARGWTAQLLVRFYFPNGTPLMANPAETRFRDAHGLVATGTPMAPVVNDPAYLQNITLSIPYYALNLMPSGGMMQSRVGVVATLYLNQFEVARSPFTQVTVFH